MALSVTAIANDLVPLQERRGGSGMVTQPPLTGVELNAAGICAAHDSHCETGKSEAYPALTRSSLPLEATALTVDKGRPSSSGLLSYAHVQIPAAPPSTILVATTDSPFPLAGALASLAAGIIFAVIARGVVAPVRQGSDSETTTTLPVMVIVPQLADSKTAISLVLRNPHSFYAQSLRDLYLSLQSTGGRHPPRTVAINSTVSEEGRSTLVAALGRLLASEGNRVLLIDCDWRHPNLHRLFRMSNDVGLTSLLEDDRVSPDDVICTDALSGLDVITAGPRPLSTGLASDRMQKILAFFTTSYELVLLDTPPVRMTRDAAPLPHLAEKIIFVVRWPGIRRKMWLGARIMKTPGHVAEVVLTCVDVNDAARIGRRT